MEILSLTKLERDIFEAKESFFDVMKTNQCEHEWENEGSADAFCSKCGMALIAHAFLEMP
jgi:hypothetical protein